MPEANLEAARQVLAHAETLNLGAPRACKTCRWLSDSEQVILDSTITWRAECENPLVKLATGHHDVTEGVRFEKTPNTVARQPGQPCGPEANLWEKKRFNFTSLVYPLFLFSIMVFIIRCIIRL